MRVALGLTLLLGALLLAAAWRGGSSSADDRTPVPGQEPEQHDGWSHLILGGPSGAQALEAQPVRGAANPPRDVHESAPDERDTEQPPDPGEFTYQVQPGDSLSGICDRFYKNRRGVKLSELVRRVAERNGLTSADAIRAGSPLVLPPLRVDEAP